MSRKLFALAMGALIFGAIGQSGNARGDDAVVVQACGHEGCGRDRGCNREGVCHPATETRKVEKRCYTDTCEQFCLPRCSCFGGLFGGGCGSCGGSGEGCGQCEANHQCGHVCVKKYLIVKIKHEDQCVPVCKVDHEACGAPACGTAQPAPAKAMPAAKPAAAARPNGQVQGPEYRYMPMPQR